MKRATIYARYSSENQKDTSIEDQVRRCRQYAQQHGLKVVQTFDDRAMSGATAQRPGYRRLMEAVKRREFDVVVVDELSRLSRDTGEVSRALDLLRYYGVAFIGVTDGVNTLTSTSSLVPEIKAAVAKEEVRQTAVRTHRGMEGQVLKGFSPGGAPYGYRLKRTPEGSILVKHRREAKIVRRIFQMYAGGMSCKVIAHWFNDRKIRGPRGGTWTPSAIYGTPKRSTGILRNEVYVGRLVWNKTRKVMNPETERRIPQLRPETEWVRKDLPALRVIPQSLWDKVRAREALVKRHLSPWRGRKTYLLTGMVRCRCGAHYTIWDRGKDGEHRMGCASNRERGKSVCPNGRRVPMEVLERVIVQTIEEDILGKNHLDEVLSTVTAYVKQQHRHAGHIQAEAQIKEIDQTLAQLRDIPKPSVLIQDQVRDLERKRERLSIDLQADEGPAEEEAAQVKRLLQRVLNPTVLRLPNIITGKKETLTIRDTRALMKLLYQDIDAGRAALRSLVEDVTLRPVGDEVEVTIKGTLGNVLRGWLATDGLIPSSDQKREIVRCGTVGAGRGI